MKKNPWIFLLALAFAFAGAAHAQYRWVDKDGKVRYGDSPPPGVKATALGAPASGSAPAAPAAAATDAKKGPMTAAEKEQDYRKRQAAKKDQEKSEKSEKAAADKVENCTRAKEYKATLDTGRVARTNAAGDRYYMDEAQIASEQAKAQQVIQQACN